MIGNYWGDYTGIDANHDGIGDSPHEIPGDLNKDYKPIFDFTPEPDADYSWKYKL